MSGCFFLLSDNGARTFATLGISTQYQNFDPSLSVGGSVGNIPFCCIFLAVEQNSRTCFHVDRRSPYLKEAWPSDTGRMSHWIFTQLFSFAPDLWVRAKRVFLPTVPSIKKKIPWNVQIFTDRAHRFSSLFDVLGLRNFPCITV